MKEHEEVHKMSITTPKKPLDEKKLAFLKAAGSVKTKGGTIDTDELCKKVRGK